ncbi:response regulator transcription factor [Paludisphaera mucosa]|uniref:Response regulator transcription factor n=1 Tax=Paludisphaera mucosa TaxID=3030827 RepID=A0ABT6FF11_9BACT|nr:response regulator transcription factor [Paludisphaera mucosa]MDG3005983.1 response regulator transcription factor [Paludisphaera mucosa]
MPRILIVEDEDKLRRALRRGLAEAGYDVVAVEDGESGLARAASEPFDCLILDVMLPGRDGLQVLDDLRAVGAATPPVLILSARGEVDDRVRGLDAGADDYLPKPFAWAELLARVRACVRRRADDGEAVLRAAGVGLDRVRRRLDREGRHAELTIRECDLLEYLMRNVGRTVGRDELARQVWGDPDAALTNVIDVYVNYLRKKLDKAGAAGLIRTVRGVGYVYGPEA